MAPIRSSGGGGDGGGGGLTLQGFPSGPMTMSGGSVVEVCVSTDIGVLRSGLALKKQRRRSFSFFSSHLAITDSSRSSITSRRQSPGGRADRSTLPTRRFLSRSPRAEVLLQDVSLFLCLLER